MSVQLLKATQENYYRAITVIFPLAPDQTIAQMWSNGPISSNIDILVRCSFQEIPSIFLQHHISKDSILFLSDFFNVYPSTLYWITAQTIDFITLELHSLYLVYKYLTCTRNGISSWQAENVKSQGTVNVRQKVTNIGQESLLDSC